MTHARDSYLRLVSAVEFHGPPCSKNHKDYMKASKSNRFELEQRLTLTKAASLIAHRPLSDSPTDIHASTTSSDVIYCNKFWNLKFPRLDADSLLPLFHWGHRYFDHHRGGENPGSFPRHLNQFLIVLDVIGSYCALTCQRWSLNYPNSRMPTHAKYRFGNGISESIFSINYSGFSGFLVEPNVFRGNPKPEKLPIVICLT